MLSVGPPLQGHLVVLHSFTTIWMGKSYGGPPSVVWPNGPKAK